MFSDPVIAEDFFDRELILDLLAKRIDGLKGGYRQNIGIIGQELLGKTSLLLQFLSKFRDKEVLPIYTELRQDGFAQFAFRFMGTLLYNFCKAADLPTKDDFNSLVETSLKPIPKTVDNIRKVEGHIEKGQLDQAYQLLLDLTTTVREESGKRSIVILDEFHRLGDFKIANPYSALGKKIMVQKDTMYIITSSSAVLAKEILKEKLSLQFGNFEIIELTPFDFETSKRFLDEKLRWLNVPSVYKRFLIALTGGQPFYLDVLSLGLKKMATGKKSGKVPLELISQTLESEIYNSRGILNQYLASRINQLEQCRGSSTYISILSAIAEGAKKLPEIARSMKKKTVDISKPIAKLMEMDFTTRYGSFYKINDPIFKFWLSSVFKRRRMSLIGEIVARSQDFKQDVGRMVHQFTDESKKTILERVKELFVLFKNESVKFGRKKYRLPHFAEVESRTVRDMELPIVARCGNKYWIAQIEEKKASEARVAEFAQKCKRSRYKVQRKILIAPKGMDINARLLAKEEKIWVWGLEELNLLLDLYDKPKVVK